MRNKRDPGYWIGTIIGYLLITIVAVGIIGLALLVVLLIWRGVGELLMWLSLL